MTKKVQVYGNTQYNEKIGKWCGHCGGARCPTKDNRCPVCNFLLRNSMRFSKFKESKIKRI